MAHLQDNAHSNYVAMGLGSMVIGSYKHMGCYVQGGMNVRRGEKKHKEASKRFKKKSDGISCQMHWLKGGVYHFFFPGGFGKKKS